MSHMVIGIIVPAVNEEDAVNVAEPILNNLCGDNGCFEYYSRDPNSFSGHDLSSPVIVNTVEGKAFLENSMRFTLDNKLRSIKLLRQYFSRYSNEELCNLEIDRGQFRYNCYRTGCYIGTSIYLYDWGGSGVVSWEHLNNIVDKRYYPDIGDSESIWIVPADVHY